ncbi:hypothetical protein CLAIMM_14142, partial [Cladophialophora immunda]
MDSDNYSGMSKMSSCRSGKPEKGKFNGPSSSSSSSSLFVPRLTVIGESRMGALSTKSPNSNNNGRSRRSTRFVFRSRIEKVAGPLFHSPCDYPGARLPIQTVPSSPMHDRGDELCRSFASYCAYSVCLFRLTGEKMCTRVVAALYNVYKNTEYMYRVYHPLPIIEERMTRHGYCI